MNDGIAAFHNLLRLLGSWGFSHTFKILSTWVTKHKTDNWFSDLLYYYGTISINRIRILCLNFITSIAFIMTVACQIKYAIILFKLYILWWTAQNACPTTKNYTYDVPHFGIVTDGLNPAEVQWLESARGNRLRDHGTPYARLVCRCQAWQRLYRTPWKS